MAEIMSFPNNSSEYIGAEEVMHWLHGRTKGVYAGEGNAAVTPIENTMQVTVAPGIGWITDADDNGMCWWFDTAITLQIDSAESTGTLNRIDRIIIEWQTTDYAALPEVKVLKGQNRSQASAPALTNNASLRQMSLAQVSIPAGTTQLTALNIVDERMNPDVCGIVTETVTADTSTIAAQYEEALEQLLAAISQAWSGVISDGSITEQKLSVELQGDLNDMETAITSLTNIASGVKDAIAIVADGNTAPQAISSGQYVLWGNALYKASTSIASGATLSTSNLTAVSDGGVNDVAANVPKLIFMGSAKWRDAPAGSLCLYKYEGQSQSTYSLPNNGYCFVLVMRATNTRGFAIAYDWRNNAGDPIWRCHLHDSWTSWERYDAQSIFAKDYSDSLTIPAGSHPSFSVSKQESGCTPIMAFMTLKEYGDHCCLRQTTSMSGSTVTISGNIGNLASSQLTVGMTTKVLWRKN